MSLPWVTRAYVIRDLDERDGQLFVEGLELRGRHFVPHVDHVDHVRPAMSVREETLGLVEDQRDALADVRRGLDHELRLERADVADVHLVEAAEHDAFVDVLHVRDRRVDRARVLHFPVHPVEDVQRVRRDGLVRGHGDHRVDVRLEVGHGFLHVVHEHPVVFELVCQLHVIEVKHHDPQVARDDQQRAVLVYCQAVNDSVLLHEFGIVD